MDIRLRECRNKETAEMKAIWNDVVVAESDDIVEVEGNAYFPLSALKREHVQDSSTHTVCPWKGRASYYSLVVNGRTNIDAAWSAVAEESTPPIAGSKIPIRARRSSAPGRSSRQRSITARWCRCCWRRCWRAAPCWR